MDRQSGWVPRGENLLPKEYLLEAILQQNMRLSKKKKSRHCEEPRLRRGKLRDEVPLLDSALVRDSRKRNNLLKHSANERLPA